MQAVMMFSYERLDLLVPRFSDLPCSYSWQEQQDKKGELVSGQLVSESCTVPKLEQRFPFPTLALW